MSTDSVHPYERLTPDRVLDAVESQGFISDARILALNSYENRVYQIGIEEQTPIIAKFYRPNRWSKEQILEEHQFSLVLQSMELPVIAPLMNKKNETLFEFDGFSFALFPKQGGYAPELANPDNLLVIGRCLGRIHRLGAAEPFQARNTINLQHFGVESVDYLCENNFIPTSLTEAYQTLTHDLLHQLARVEKEYSVAQIRVHGDCHSGNILWRNNGPYFVDFDDTAMAPAIQDLWMLLSGDRQSQTIQMAEILEGYCEFHHFNLAELNLIEYFRTLRLLHYSAWLARRWKDPAFPMAFTWFNTDRYWAEHILALREQLASINEAPLAIFGKL
ncbi:MAG: serine/threonine protein kinase [Endozoicomonas sp. (ex Botrylloides leachii)]|nr:serine/threonine protein kinase [Endozoicomonas sp. (ex Botrylloides leachii)]